MRRVILTGAALAVIIVLVAVFYKIEHKTSQSNSITQSITTGSASDTIHFFIIVDENKTYGSIIGNRQAPYINQLANRYALATNYSAITHPSFPNYLALTSGSTHGVTSDCNPPAAGCELDVPNIADEIQKSGRSWKEYAESMPVNCYANNSGHYATKHNPFIYYSDIINNKTWCSSHVVPLTQLSEDLRTPATTPNFAMVTPDLCDDMHDCSIATGDGWLSKYVKLILNSKAFTSQPSVLVITWDEGNLLSNHIAAILAGRAVKSGYRSSTAYDHYSLLRTIEDVWQLPSLTANDQQAKPMTEFFK